MDFDSIERQEAARVEQQRINFHIQFVGYLAVLLFLLIGARYAWIQLIQGEALAARIRRESGEAQVIQSPRGAILDRNGKELAISLMMKSLFIDPNNVENPLDVASKLAPLIGMKEDEILRDIAQGGGFVWVKHFLSTDEYAAVRKLIYTEGYNCLGFQTEPHRVYPNEALAANILGFVGADDTGLYGIEQAYDEMIKGDKSEQYVQMDNISSRPVLDSIFSRKQKPVDSCKTIELTIDSTVQFMVEEALEEAMADTQPAAVTAIIMRPKTGEILAMATRPSYNPNKFDEYKMELWSNNAVSAIYEPGSTFKSIVTAAALQENIVTPNQVFVDPGHVTVSERRIQNWNGESFGTVTFTDVVTHSLNTGFALVGLDLGAQKMTDYAKRFGFGTETGIELPAEVPGILFEPDDMRDSDMATMAIGQSIAVTPLQLVTAMSAIANDGVLMKPYIVRAVKNADGSIFEETKPTQVRRAIDSVTDKTVVGLLEQVVATGGGKKAQVAGYRIAGKTGTAEKINTERGGYLEGRYIASFCGFAPVEAPELAVLVVIDDPSGVFYGGQIAAPVASRIFSQVLRYLKVEPSGDPLQREREREKEHVRSDGTQSTVSKQVVVPSVLGMDAAEATRTLEAAGLRVVPRGRGRAVEQSIDANAVVLRGTTVTVQFSTT